MALIEWVRNLTPAQAFFFSLPFGVAIAGFVQEWWSQWRSKASRMPE